MIAGQSPADCETFISLTRDGIFPILQSITSWRPHNYLHYSYNRHYTKHYLHTNYTLSKHYLRTVYTPSTHYLHTLSTHYLPTIYTPRAGPGARVGTPTSRSSATGCCATWTPAPTPTTPPCPSTWTLSPYTRKVRSYMLHVCVWTMDVLQKA